jgi:hypothetical protein
MGDRQIELENMTKITLAGGNILRQSMSQTGLAASISVGEGGDIGWDSWGVSSSAVFPGARMTLTHEIMSGRLFPVAWRTTAEMVGREDHGMIRAWLRVTVEPTPLGRVALATEKTAAVAMAVAAIADVAGMSFMVSTPVQPEAVLARNR